MRIFITGASGFAGGAIAVRLQQSGHTVSAMGRSQKSIEKLQSLNLTPVSCDLETIEAKHLTNIDVVVHCAAYVEEWGTEEDFYNTNVLGTQHVLDAATVAGVRRFIHIGTEAAVFYGQDMTNIDETTPYADASHYPYTRTKAEAERRVLAANADGGMKTLSIRPRFIWGPGDRVVLAAVKRMIDSGKFAWIGGGAYQTSTTHVTNLAHAVELALTKGRGGHAYFVTDDTTQAIRNFLTQYLHTQNITPPNKTLPKPIARFAAHVVESTWNVLWKGHQPPLTRFAVDMASVNCTIVIEKAKKELGYSPVISVDEGLRSMPLMFP